MAPTLTGPAADAYLSTFMSTGGSVALNAGAVTRDALRARTSPHALARLRLATIRLRGRHRPFLILPPARRTPRCRVARPLAAPRRGRSRRAPDRPDEDPA